MKEIIKEFIINNTGLDELDDDLELFKGGLVNSLFAIELMTFIEKTFDIKVRMEDLEMNNFESVNNIKEFVLSKQLQLEKQS